MNVPVRPYPIAHADVTEPARVIVIDPLISFGTPVIAGKGIGTGTIASRIDAGESIADVAADYELTEAEVEEALVYELAA